MTVPKRKVTFKVYAKGQRDQMSHSPAVLAVSNPQPALPTQLGIEAGFRTIFINYKAPDDLDWKGLLIWASTVQGFVPGDSNKVYDGPDTSIAIGNLSSDTEYFIRLAAYDAFGKTGLNVSAEFSVTTLLIGQYDYENLSIKNAHINSLSAGKLEADSVISKRIFIGKIGLDGTKDLIYVDDKQTSPVRRVRIGKLGTNIYDYGIEIRNKLGKLIFGANGLETKVVNVLNLDDAVSSRLFDTGDYKETSSTVLRPGWVWARGGTIGNAQSNASERAHADAWNLYKIYWEGYLEADLPVSGGRGASALADFDLNKKIEIPNRMGRVGVGAGQGSGLTNRRLGEKTGEEKHKQTIDELVEHDHDEILVKGRALSPSPLVGQRDRWVSGNTSKAGGGKPFNVMQPLIGVNIMIKL